jgi:hypothetical protein
VEPFHPPSIFCRYASSSKVSGECLNGAHMQQIT